MFMSAAASLSALASTHNSEVSEMSVYADFKFKEPMKVLIYPYEESEMLSRCAELAESLQAFNSYNSRDLESSNGKE